jgi:predicted SAM-dependent methyltransferase
VKKRRAKNELLCVVIGGSTPTPYVGLPGTNYEGWLITDIDFLDALRPVDWHLVFSMRSVDRILAEHVLEHWTEEQLRTFLRTVRRFLSRRGLIRIAVPDGFHPDPTYVDWVKPGGSGLGADDHKVLYNYITLTRILSEESWKYDLLEYFDEHGQFHITPWSMADGFVERSSCYDPRNKERPLSYTSLIVDAHPRAGRDGS